ncbi:MAG TPA: hypothetical protein VGL77_17700, partial [Armatimonadota bacterium]
LQCIVVYKFDRRHKIPLRCCQSYRRLYPLPLGDEGDGSRQDEQANAASMQRQSVHRHIQITGATGTVRVDDAELLPVE